MITARPVPVCLLAVLTAMVPRCAAQAARDLSEATLEQLMSVRVTSVSKKEQQLARAAAAIFVVRQEDIRRSGATNIPDLLRMVPGVQVARIDANAWAISIRGFNTRYSNKVLVLIDGRTVYSPSFSGVFWDQQGLPLEDIERIEVIRGPGATVWGANAVNGVINIITKSSKATRGGLLALGSGNDIHAGSMARYGGAAGSAATYRVFGEYGNIGDSRLANGASGADGWRRVHGGFRTDWDLSARDSLTVEGSSFSNSEGQTRWAGFLNGAVTTLPLASAYSDTITSRGGDLLGRWKHDFTGGSGLAVQVFADVYRRVDLGSPEIHKSIDLDLQHHVAFGSRHDVVWGLGFRSTRTGLGPSAASFVPVARTDQLSSAFLQDEIRLPGSWWLTVGSKFEHNAYTGFEYEPGVSLAWTPSLRHTVWFSAARAIRQPSRLDTQINVELGSIPSPASVPLTFVLRGNPDFQAEQLKDLEAGYRAQLTKTVSVDVAGFVNQYQRLATYEPASAYPVPNPSAPGLLFPMKYGNLAHATNYGAELSATWRATPRWQLSPGYSYIVMKTELNPESRNPYGSLSLGDAPRHMFQIRSQHSLTRRVDFDNSFYYTSSLPLNNIPGHGRLDTRIAWRIGESVELSVTGQNLLRPGTMEFGDAFAVAGTEVKRSVYAKVTWRF